MYVQHSFYFKICIKNVNPYLLAIDGFFLKYNPADYKKVQCTCGDISGGLHLIFFPFYEVINDEYIRCFQIYFVL